jgi:CRISPR system Cascade subunit CasE
VYLSRLILNPRSQRVQRELAEPYELHRSLMRAFACVLGKEAERVLFRVEEEGRGEPPTLLVQSWTMPDWSWLAENGARGYLLSVGIPNPAVKSFDLALAPGQVLAFRLRANPTARRRLPDGSRKRIGLYDEEEQRDWMARKARHGGFQLLSLYVRDEVDVTGQLRRDGETHPLKLFAVRFEGLLQVVDPRAVRDVVRAGIGSGKGFGFGLLSLAPLR